MATYNPAGGKQYYLGSSISSTATSILLSSFLEPVTGVPYTMVLLNTDIAYGTIGPKTSSSEFISFTGITQNANGTATLTGVTRGLAKKYPFTEDSDYKQPHSGQSIFILSDAPQVFQKYVSLDNTQTVGGIKTFTLSPVVPTGGTGTQAANNQDIANAITGASGTATDSTFGTVKLSVAAASVPDPIVVGTNDPRVPTQDENNALAGTSGTPSSTNKYETENDTSNAATITGTGISFTAATKTIADSGNGFVTANFRAGDSVIVTGTSSNNGTYTIVSVAAGAIVVVEALVNESAGGSFTLTTATINKVVRYSASSQVKVPLVPVANNDAPSKSYTDTADTSLSNKLLYTVNADETAAGWVSAYLGPGQWTVLATATNYANGSQASTAGGTQINGGKMRSVINGSTSGNPVQFADNTSFKIKYAARPSTPSGTGGGQKASFYGFTNATGASSALTDVGNSTHDRAGFLFYNGNRYIVSNSAGGSITSTNLGAYTVREDTYAIVVTGTTSVQFFINGTSVGTLSTNVPGSANDITILFAESDSPGSGAVVFVGDCVLSQKTS